jgi:hypothetical protein
LFFTLGGFGQFNKKLVTVPDSVYTIQFVSADDSSFLPFVGIYINGMRYYESDMDGKIKMATSDVYFSKVKDVYHAKCPGYKTLIFSESTLLLNKTRIFALRPNSPTTLLTLEVASYGVPIIDPDVRKLTRKEKHNLKRHPKIQEIKDTAICYSLEELAFYDSLVKGTWKIFVNQDHSATSLTNWGKLLSSYIRYPERARDWYIEETIYIEFELDTNGCIKNIKLGRGKNPVLVLEVVKALLSMPCLEQNNTYGSSQKRQAEKYVLPVKFYLR